ncbi:MAG: DUF4232 domain-containing protein [Actinomycetota bacterium]|nr:DUF4232 domain-containing protein [Actinomycetota bacterium]
MRTRSLGAVALVSGLALVCSACGGGQSAAPHRQHKVQPQKAHSQEPSSTTTTSAPPPSTTTTTAPVAASGPPRCTFAHLSVSVGQVGAGLGHEGVAILFENTGTSTCSLSGYPGVAALDSAGQQVAQAQRTPSGYLGGMQTGSTTPPVVLLGPGAVASALVEGTDVPEGVASSCPTYPALLVTPPTSTLSARLTVSLPGCSPIEVHPIVSGSTGTTKPASG